MIYQHLKRLVLTLGFTAFAVVADVPAQRLDTTFNPGSGATGFVETVLEQPDGKILICGNFTSFAGTNRANIARLHADGSVDQSFNASPGYWVRHMTLQPDGKIIIGGFFKSVAGQPRGLIARLNGDGSLDGSFNPGTGATGTLGVSITGNPDPFIFFTALQTDGKILITGNFTNYNGRTINGIARLNANGTLDESFDVGPGLNTWGRSIQVLPNGKILATGWFDNYRNTGHHRMVLINPDGSPDNSFNTFFGDKTSIYDAALLPDGKYIVVGHSLNEQGLFRQDMARLLPNGIFDTNFTASANEKVESVAIQPDGKILITGYFTLVNGVQRKGVARLNADGSLDPSFNAALNDFSYGWTVALQQDGRVLLSGGFSSVDGVSRNGVARLLGDGIVQPPLRLSVLPRSGNTMSVLVPTVSGKTYTLEYRPSLSVSNWSSASSVAGDGTTKTLSDSSATGGARFYRVRQN